MSHKEPDADTKIETDELEILNPNGLTKERFKFLIDESLNSGPVKPLDDLETLYRMARKYRASKTDSN